MCNPVFKFILLTTGLRLSGFVTIADSTETASPEMSVTMITLVVRVILSTISQNASLKLFLSVVSHVRWRS